MRQEDSYNSKFILSRTLAQDFLITQQSGLHTTTTMATSLAQFILLHRYLLKLIHVPKYISFKLGI